MASVNWTLYESDRTPVPLPQEKFLFEARKVTLLLFPSVPGAPLNQQSKDKSKERQADGTIYASNQRICFVASSQQSSSTSFFSFAKTSSSEGTKLESLSVPYAAFTDSRFVQPTFSASYIDALVLPSAEGGLDGPHIARISFYEGGAADFYSVVTECKARLGDTASNIAEPESLPLYAPPEEAGPNPNDSAFEAADVARACEARENAESVSAATAVSPQQTPRPPNEMPPGYEP